MLVNLKKSNEVADSIRAKKRQCYRNACVAAVIYHGVYVEGYASFKTGFGPLALPHAWVELDGEILETTWLARFNLVPAHSYFPGQRYDLDEIVDRMNGPSSPPWWNDGDGAVCREAFKSCGLDLLFTSDGKAQSRPRR